MRSSKCYYLVEGQSEEAFFIFLKEKGYIRPGKIRIFNLMQKELSIAQDFLSERNADFICIIDTDVVENKNLMHLANNIRLLKKKGNPRILMQCSNFEDELCRILLCKRHSLFDKVGCSANKNHILKRHLSKMTSDDYNRILQRELKSRQMDKVLSSYCSLPNDIILSYLEQCKLDKFVIKGTHIIKIKAIE